jgi:hypothetical protein
VTRIDDAGVSAAPAAGAAPSHRIRPVTRWVLAGAVLGLLLAVPGVLLLRATSTSGPDRVAPVVPLARDVVEAAPTWGGRFAWPGGVSVAVAAPVPCTPAPDAAPARVARAVLFRVTVVNRSREPFDAGQFTVFDDASFDGRSAEPVIDTNGPCGSGGLDAVPVLPGRSCSYDLAYAVGPHPGAMRLLFQPGPDAAKVTFTGRA